MIQEAETLIEYGYLVMDLPPQSYKPILATCDNCSKVRETSKNNYRALCRSCAHKGKIFTEEHKGNMSKNQPDRSGEKNPNYNGGKKIVKARTNARRKRDLGYIPLNSYFEGSEGHHITHNFVVYIPAYMHKSIWHNINSSQGMEVINKITIYFLLYGI